MRFISGNMQWLWVNVRIWEKVPGIVLLPVRYRSRMSTMYVGGASLRLAKLRLNSVETSPTSRSSVESFARDIYRNRRARKFFSRFTHRLIGEVSQLQNIGNAAGGSCYSWQFARILLCGVFVAEVLHGREIIALMLYIGNCKMHVSSSVLNERTNAMGSLEDFDIATLLQKVIAFFDGFSSDETEPTG